MLIDLLSAYIYVGIARSIIGVILLIILLILMRR